MRRMEEKRKKRREEKRREEKRRGVKIESEGEEKKIKKR